MIRVLVGGLIILVDLCTRNLVREEKLRFENKAKRLLNGGGVKSSKKDRVLSDFF